jgi:hypothetical protein
VIPGGEEEAIVRGQACSLNPRTRELDRTREPASRTREPSGARGRAGALAGAVTAVLGLLWWGAALRLAIRPGGTDTVAAAMVSGWTLSILPVHCLPARGSRRRRGRRWTARHRNESLN